MYVKVCVLVSMTTGKETEERRIYYTAENYHPKMAEVQGFEVRHCQHTLPGKVSVNILLRFSKQSSQESRAARGRALEEASNE